MPLEIKQTEEGSFEIVKGDKTLNLTDVESIIENADKTAAKAEKVANIFKTAEAYGLEPEEFLEQSVMGLSTISKMINDGIIDANGNVVKKDPNKKETKENPDLDSLFNLNKKEDETPKLGAGEKAILEALTKINGRIDNVEKSVEESESIQTNMIRNNYKREIVKEYPNLSDDDVDKIFATAMGLKNMGKKVDLMEIAKEKSEEVGANKAAVEKAFAEKHGLDYEELIKKADPNSLEQQEAKGGMPVILAGKKVSFLKRGDGFVSPGKATQEFLRNRNKG